jgi:hypothetical protein
MRQIAKNNGKIKTLKSEVLIQIGSSKFIAPDAATASQVADLLSSFESLDKMEWHTEGWQKYGDVLHFCEPHPVSICNFDTSKILETTAAAKAEVEKLTAEAEAEIATKGQTKVGAA